jgi:hypothetical protein
LQGILGERLECRNISRNILQVVLRSGNEHRHLPSQTPAVRCGLLVLLKHVAVFQRIGNGRVVSHLAPFAPSGLERLIVDGGARNR